MEGKVNSSLILALRCRCAGCAAARAGKDGSLVVGYVVRVDEAATEGRVSSSFVLLTAARRCRFAGGSCAVTRGDDARAGLEPAADELFGTHATNSPPAFRLLKTIGGERKEVGKRKDSDNCNSGGQFRILTPRSNFKLRQSTI